MPAKSPDTVDIEAEVPLTPGVVCPEREWVFISPVIYANSQPVTYDATASNAVSATGRAAPAGRLYFCSYGLIFLTAGRRETILGEKGHEFAHHLFSEAVGWGVASLVESGIQYYRGNREFEKALHHPETFVLPATSIVGVSCKKPPPPEKWWHFPDRRSSLIVTSEDDHGTRETWNITPKVVSAAMLGQWVWMMRFYFELIYFNVAGLSIFLPHDARLEIIPEYLQAVFNTKDDGVKLSAAVHQKIQQALSEDPKLWWRIKLNSLYHLQRFRRVNDLDRLYDTSWRDLDSVSATFQPMCCECLTLNPPGAQSCTNCSRALC